MNHQREYQGQSSGGAGAGNGGKSVSEEQRGWMFFQNAATSLTQMYRESENQKKLAFYKGKIEAMQMMGNWLKDQESQMIANENANRHNNMSMGVDYHHSEGNNDSSTEGNHSRSIKIETLLCLVENYIVQCEEGCLNLKQQQQDIGFVNSNNNNSSNNSAVNQNQQQQQINHNNSNNNTGQSSSTSSLSSSSGKVASMGQMTPQPTGGDTGRSPTAATASSANYEAGSGSEEGIHANESSSRVGYSGDTAGEGGVTDIIPNSENASSVGLGTGVMSESQMPAGVVGKEEEVAGMGMMRKRAHGCIEEYRPAGMFQKNHEDSAHSHSNSSGLHHSGMGSKMRESLYGDENAYPMGNRVQYLTHQPNNHSPHPHHQYTQSSAAPDNNRSLCASSNSSSSCPSLPPSVMRQMDNSPHGQIFGDSDMEVGEDVNHMQYMTSYKRSRLDL
eukprot:Nk52_evm15s226 gene=Nk52_evmTU15s226